MKITRPESAAFLVLALAPLHAQSGESAPISSDRPGFLFAPTLVPPGPPPPNRSVRPRFES